MNELFVELCLDIKLSKFNKKKKKPAKTLMKLVGTWGGCHEQNSICMGDSQ